MNISHVITDPSKGEQSAYHLFECLAFIKWQKALSKIQDLLVKVLVATLFVGYPVQGFPSDFRCIDGVVQKICIHNDDYARIQSLVDSSNILQKIKQEISDYEQKRGDSGTLNPVYDAHLSKVFTNIVARIVREHGQEFYQAGNFKLISDKYRGVLLPLLNTVQPDLFLENGRAKMKFSSEIARRCRHKTLAQSAIQRMCTAARKESVRLA